MALLTASLVVLSLHPAALRGASRVVHRRHAPTERIQPPRAAAELTFESLDDYTAHLASEAALPDGFRVGVSGFEFTPAEADMRAVMNLTLIALDSPTTSFAGTFTRNAFCGSPVTVGKERIRSSPAVQAILVNNKISNVCAAGDGVAASEAVCAALAQSLGLEGGAEAVIPCSTGVIGWALPVDQMVDALPAAVSALQSTSALPAASGIMTTDRFPKLRAEAACGGRLVGIVKGAGMIEPNMATMLAFVLTDVDVPRDALQAMLRRAADVSFNCVSVDADQSTSDTLLCLSSRKTPLPTGDAEQAAALAEFEAALTRLTTSLAADMVRNGEGTSHVIRVDVRGAPSAELARAVGKAVVNSNLFKTAVAGNDPNVGRLVAAVGSYLGRAAPDLALDGCTMSLGGRTIFRAGSFDIDPQTETVLSAHMRDALLTEPETNAERDYPPHQRCVEVGIELGVGDAACVVYGSDMTEEYVHINADYRS